jgi:MFS family permease
VVADRGGLQVDVDAAFVLAAVMFVLAAISVISVFGIPKQEKESISTAKSKASEVFSIKGFKSAILVSGSITAVIDVMLVFLPLLGRQLGFSATEVGILLAVRAVASMSVRIILGPISSRFGMRATLNFGSLVTAVSLVAIALSSNFWLLVVLMFIAGFATGIGQPVTMAWVSRISPAEIRGLAISIRLTSNRLGQVVVPALAGALAVFGAGTIFWLLAALQAGSYVVIERALKGKK